MGVLVKKLVSEANFDVKKCGAADKMVLSKGSPKIRIEHLRF